MQPDREQIFAPWLPTGWKNLVISWNRNELAGLTLAGPESDISGTNPTKNSTGAKLVLEVISGRKSAREIPLCLEGLSPWGKRVVQQMLEIPFGETLSYGKIAANLGNPGAARAVAQVCARNKIGLVIPCHRVTASNGLGGFFWGLPMKERILRFEAEQRKLLEIRPT